MSHNPTTLKAQFLPLFNVDLSQPQLILNSISTKLRLNLISTSFQPQPQINLSLNINLNSTSTLTSTQYGCDIKATQSCCLLNRSTDLLKATHFQPATCEAKEQVLWVVNKISIRHASTQHGCLDQRTKM